ncbi:hypothetical protein C8039_13635 [Halogeometricum sp. wsp3]|nr:hypothetical protein C8039_13635 [Halogeometricum sp. wsp3]
MTLAPLHDAREDEDADKSDGTRYRDGVRTDGRRERCGPGRPSNDGPAINRLAADAISRRKYSSRQGSRRCPALQ